MGVRVPPSALTHPLSFPTTFTHTVNRPLLAVLALVMLTGACTDGVAQSDDTVQHQIDIYSATIREVAVVDRPDLNEDSVDPVIFVSPLTDTTTISLDVQLGVVLALENWATIRFIDEFEEAILVNEPDSPVRDNGVLIGLGQIDLGPSEARLVADRYEQANDLLTFDLLLQRRSGEWSVVEPVDHTRVTVH